MRIKKEGKNIAKAHAAVEKRPYILQDAVSLLQKVKFAKFDETVDFWSLIPSMPTRWSRPHGIEKVLVIATVNAD